MNVIDPIGHGLTSGWLSYNAAMRLGLALPNAMRDGAPLTGPALIAGARAAEREGFDRLWCFYSIGRVFMIPDPLIAVKRGGDGHRASGARHRNLTSAAPSARGAGAPHSRRASHLRRPTAPRRRRGLDEGRLRRRRR